jgi:O-antigen ligase
MCFLGVMKSRFSWVYFSVATLAYIAAVMTLSRNALLVGGIAYCACAVASCFIGRYKKVYRIIVSVGAFAVAVGAILLWDRIAVLLSDFLERGFSDNGRYELWKTGIDNFLISPLFGTGFFQYVSDTFVSATFVPKLAHQTFIQLLSCMGIFGLAAYFYYRVASLIPFVKRPNVDKSMLLASVAVMLSMSLIDNFIFRFLHVIHYSIALAIGFVIYEQQCKIESELKPLN